MILNIDKYINEGYLKAVEGGYVLYPKAPAQVQKELFELNEEYNKIMGEDIIFYGKEPEKEK